jgi:hypothetical protein
LSDLFGEINNNNNNKKNFGINLFIGRNDTQLMEGRKKIKNSLSTPYTQHNRLLVFRQKYNNSRKKKTSKKIFSNQSRETKKTQSLTIVFDD